MMNLTRTETAEYLRRFDNYVLLTHKRPDGDTLGSAAALCRGLRALGKTCHILTNPEVTPRYSWLHQGLTVTAPEDGDLLISVDVATPEMLPGSALPLLDRIALRIDHHESGKSFTPLELVDGDSAACAEVVWDILELLGAPRTEQTMEALYVGVSTDTGCFRYSNVTAHSFATAAACAQAGVKIYELNQQLFEINTLQRLKMQAWVVDHLQLLSQGTMAVVAIPKSVERAMGVTEDDMDNISSFPRNVAGVHMAATLRELDNGTVKLSVRAVPGFDATRLAEAFGGGGHRGAAGATLDCPISRAAQAVGEAMQQLAVL